MDEVIINSEPLWKEAEIKVFDKVGIKLTPTMCNETKGTRMDKMVSILITKQGELLSGVMQSLTLFRELGFKIGIGVLFAVITN